VAAIAESALEHDLHSLNPGQPGLEILEQGHVRAADHDQELDIGERQRRERRQEQGRVPRAVTVCLGRIVEGRLLAQLSRPALGTARRADDFHDAGEPWPPPASARPSMIPEKFSAAHREGTTL
jgi:hypothetical protein